MSTPGAIKKHPRAGAQPTAVLLSKQDFDKLRSHTQSPTKEVGAGSGAGMASLLAAGSSVPLHSFSSQVVALSKGPVAQANEGGSGAYPSSAAIRRTRSASTRPSRRLLAAEGSPSPSPSPSPMPMRTERSLGPRPSPPLPARVMLQMQAGGSSSSTSLPPNFSSVAGGGPPVALPRQVGVKGPGSSPTGNAKLDLVSLGVNGKDPRKLSKAAGSPLTIAGAPAFGAAQPSGAGSKDAANASSLVLGPAAPGMPGMFISGMKPMRPPSPPAPNDDDPDSERKVPEAWSDSEDELVSWKEASMDQAEQQIFSYRHYRFSADPNRYLPPESGNTFGRRPRNKKPSGRGDSHRRESRRNSQDEGSDQEGCYEPWSMSARPGPTRRWAWSRDSCRGRPMQFLRPALEPSLLL